MNWLLTSPPILDRWTLATVNASLRSRTSWPTVAIGAGGVAGCVAVSATSGAGDVVVVEAVTVFLSSSPMPPMMASTTTIPTIAAGTSHFGRLFGGCGG